MILNKILSVGFLIGIHSNVAEGVFPIKSGGMLANHMAPHLSPLDLANFARVNTLANKIVAPKLSEEFANWRTTELINSYKEVVKSGSKNYSNLNMECDRRMAVFMSLFKDKDIKSDFEELKDETGKSLLAQKLLEEETEFARYISSLKEDSLDACVILESFPFVNAVDFFLLIYMRAAIPKWHPDSKLLPPLGKLPSEPTFRKMVKGVIAIANQTLNHVVVDVPLDIATALGYTETVKLLLDLGSPRPRDDLNKLLLPAGQRQRLKIVKLLIERGADVNCRDKDGSVLLSYAAGFGNTAMAKLLLDHKADVNRKDGHGNVPLEIAARRGDRKMAERLLNAGAFDKIQEASSLAATSGHTELANLLAARGANGVRAGGRNAAKRKEEK